MFFFFNKKENILIELPSELIEKIDVEIVKRLGSIQTFGQMNILCTDKTGTLTEDNVILEKYMDVSGKESIRILKHAFLNSYFQTGLKNLIDVAIISRAEKENLNVLKEKYTREDEIPFDFVQIGMPLDNVDNEYIQNPKTWNTNGIKRFMFYFGLISTVLDVLCFIVLWYVFKFNSVEQAVMFQSGWFVFGILSQTLIIHLIRTSKIPFIESKSSKQLLISTFAVVILTLIIAFTDISVIFDLSKLPYMYLLWIVILMIVYVTFIQIYKRFYIKKNLEWL